MIDIGSWTEQLLHKAEEAFGERLWFVGLQGSYARGEATATSDIDIVVILDDLSFSDIQKYNSILNLLPYRELACGFLSGKEELLNWEPSDLFQFYYDTTPIKGSLDELLTVIDEAAVGRAIKIGACNIYHGCVHNMLIDKSDEILYGLYKSASFVVQAIVFKQTGKYIKSQKELLSVAASDEQTVIRNFLNLKNGVAVDFSRASEALLGFSKKWIVENRNERKFTGRT